MSSPPSKYVCGHYVTESYEVCEDELCEECPYCKIDRLEKRNRELEVENANLRGGK